MSTTQYINNGWDSGICFVSVSDVEDVGVICCGVSTLPTSMRIVGHAILQVVSVIVGCAAAFPEKVSGVYIQVDARRDRDHLSQWERHWIFYFCRIALITLITQYSPHYLGLLICLLLSAFTFFFILNDRSWTVGQYYRGHCGEDPPYAMFHSIGFWLSDLLHN